MTEQERYLSTTPFQTLYNRFFSRVTDDMYMEWTEEDTRKDIKNILLNSIPRFEFPKFKLYDYDPDKAITDAEGNALSEGQFNFKLVEDEILIFVDLMIIEWISRQLITVDNTRMKFASSDFKFTSQANHMDKLLKMKKEYETVNKHTQKLYNRRKIDDNGYIKPNFAGLGGSN